MKQKLVLFIFLLSALSLQAQIKIGGETNPKFEYATVTARVIFQNNGIIYNETGYNNSPMVYLPNGDRFILKNSTVKSGDNRFTNMNEIINYMSNEGWRLISHSAIQNKFDTQRDKENDLFYSRNFDELYQQLIFERQKN